jgi:hypothetical protein
MAKFYDGLTLGDAASVAEEPLTAEQRRSLKPSDFGIPSKRTFPLIDAVHVRSAISRFSFVAKADRAELAANIVRRAGELGVEIESKDVLSAAREDKK